MTFVSRASIANVLGAVRNTVLNWALQLEADGVLGEGLAFSDSEVEVAAKQGYNMNNFYGPVGQAQIQQATRGSAQFQLDLDSIRQVVDDIEKQLDSLQLEADEQAEIRAELDTVRAQLASPRPKPGVIVQGLATVSRVLESAAGGAAAYLVVEIGKLLAR
jgi:hypothetical protein